MGEVIGNKLVERDADTNAIIPVMRAYSEDLEGKKVSGNKLIVRDPDTNAIIPVVKVIGGGTGSGSPADEEQIRQIVKDELEALNLPDGTITSFDINSLS